MASPQGKNYTLKANSDSEKKQWMEWLRDAIYRANTLLDSGFQRKGWLEKVHCVFYEISEKFLRKGKDVGLY